MGFDVFFMVILQDLIVQWEVVKCEMHIFLMR
jgi:hypothetical protein